MKILVTGGAGFIGSAVVRHLIAETDHQVVNLDKLGYAASADSLGPAAASPRYRFARLDILDQDGVAALLAGERPRLVMHLAAESHVDRSIDGPESFIQANVVGTLRLLEAVREHWSGLPADEREGFRFHHVSTDEVFGSLGDHGAFTENSPYAPRSPYSASKAASDHLVRAWHHTYGLPVVLSNCSNNYGPCQFPEKLIPLMILNALRRHPLPVYGRGANIRDWLFVEDHARALLRVATEGRIGESYNIGGRSERTNLQVVETICDLIDEFTGRPAGDSRRLITWVADRPGHDHRYAVDAGKAEAELGIRPSVDFDTGLKRTVRWYLDNEAWWRPLLDRRYAGQRLGLAHAG